MDFGAKLKMLRARKNIIQEELAKILNVSRPTIGRYETNERFPDKDTLIKLSEYFNVSIDYLLGVTDIQESANDLIKKGEVAIKPPSEIEKIYESLPAEEKKMLEDYGDYLETRAKLTDRNKENSSTSKGLKDKRAE